MLIYLGRPFTNLTDFLFTTQSTFLFDFLMQIGEKKTLYSY